MFRTFACLLIIASSSHAVVIQDLTPEESYPADAPRPAEFFGFEAGKWHLRPDQLNAYVRALAGASPRVQVETIGRTHELREQLLVAISHPDNIARLEAIRKGHLDYLNGRTDTPGPLIVWLGYSIHGDEASGSNAAPLVAYHLAAARSTEEWLKDMVILIDPSLNPDGMGRYAQWANSNRSRSPVPNPAHREHLEHWPAGGRTNHYWFDLNRDWLLLVHPESRNRVAVFQQWRPHVFGDFHEMGGSTYFFQPGVPARENPLTPDENFDITGDIAEFHARAFDAIGQLYFTREQFDDYYYGKGSTYPDIQGSIGILFEQASPRGIELSTDDGPLTLELAIRNHFTTSLSTLEGARANAERIKAYQRNFLDVASERARSADGRGIVFGSSADPYRAHAMAERLHRHGIEVYELDRPLSIGERRFVPGTAFVVPFDQPQYPLLAALIEIRTEFEDTTFYDVSTWTFPLAFDLPTERLGDPADYQGERYTGDYPKDAPRPSPGYAYAIAWEQYLAPKALGRLLNAGPNFRVRVATKPFTAETADGPQNFGLGTVVVPAPGPDYRAELDRILGELANEDGLVITTLTSGLTSRGVDLGSSSLAVVEPIRPALITGEGVNSLEAGEVWHLLDVRMGMPPVMIDMDRLASTDLDDYTHLMMVDGRYSIAPETVTRLREWMNAGGVLVTSKAAAAWATQQGLHLPLEAAPTGDQPPQPDPMQPPDKAEEPATEPRPYGNYSDDYSRAVIGGAIVAADIDPTHPLLYGYSGPTLPLFRNGTDFFRPSDNPYETPIRYRQEPLLSGYLGEARRKQLAGSAALITTKVGSGALIRFADNPNFRGYWYGTSKLYLNALYFAQILEATPLPDSGSRL